METKSSILLIKLIDFYNIQDNFNKLQIILDGKGKISMRIIEWYISVYSKKYNRILHCEYKNILRGLNKANFDPYRRKIKGKETIFLFECHSGHCYTSVAQANFYKWIIEKEILEQITKDWESINKIFIEFNQNKKEIMKNKIIG